ncbi:MAG: hypothetical protein JNN33_05910 [Rhodospirillaceae bacterium]|nr:hypothetical protein [Rhodospirillaceae bacterium]
MMALAACALAGGVMACQSPGTGTSYSAATAVEQAGKKKSKYEDYKPTAPMKARFTDMTLALTRKLLERCLDLDAPMAACFRDRLLNGFDTAGIAEKRCPPGDDLEEQYNCIVVGSYSYRFVQVIGKQAEPDIDWSDPERSMQAVSIDYALTKLKNCLGGSSASDPTDCVMAGFIKELDLTEEEVEPCRSLTNDSEFGQCIGEAYGLRFMADGIARM